MPCLFFSFVILDFVFVRGTEVIFKVALCLLSSHEGEIVECDSFESIVDYLKTTLPTLTQVQMEQTIAKVQKGKLYEIQSQVFRLLSATVHVELVTVAFMSL